MQCLILEDELLLADLLAQSLRMIPGLHVAGVAHDVKGGKYLCERQKPDLLLMDLLLPDGNGVEAAEALMNVKPSAKILVLSAQAEKLRCSRSLHDAIIAVMDKCSDINAIHDILKQHLQPENNNRQRGSLVEDLTERERDILRLIGHGLSSSEIALGLNISIHTARTHRRNITGKLGVTRSELVLMAHEYFMKQG